MTITLAPPTEKALNELLDATGMSKTDAINRALVLYRLLEEVDREGGRILIQRTDEEIQRVHFI
jgi:hypothetical protein